MLRQTKKQGARGRRPSHPRRPARLAKPTAKRRAGKRIGSNNEKAGLPRRSDRNANRRAVKDEKGRTGRRAVRGRGADRCKVTVAVVERVGSERDEAQRSWEVEMTPEAWSGRGAVGRLGRLWPRLCRVFAALGHAERAKILAKLLEGPATYRSLQHVTKAKAGPLYHHVNQLRLARLILPKQRDLYELTRGGRNVILAAVALGPLTADPRRRPTPAERPIEGW